MEIAFLFSLDTITPVCQRCYANDRTENLARSYGVIRFIQSGLWLIKHHMSGVNQVMSERRSAFMGRTCGQLGSELKHLVLLYLKCSAL